MKDRHALAIYCDEVLADKSLSPVRDGKGKIVKTFCNIGAMRIANALECSELDNMMADVQYQVMDENKSGNWLKVSGNSATVHALSGGLAFASMTGAMLGEIHGHIAAVYPAPTEESQSLKKWVPVVANIGRNNGLMKASQAFPVAKGECDYFAWQG